MFVLEEGGDVWKSAPCCTFCFTETLEMNNLPCPQETDRVGHFWHVFDDAEDVVVGGTGFLFGRQIFE